MDQGRRFEADDGCIEVDAIYTDLPDSVISPHCDTWCKVPINQARAADGVDDQAQPFPFVVQHERSLFFLTWELTRWTLAELVFDPATCTFVEQRRSHYEWPREAFGVLLSRFALIERVDKDLLKRTSDDFARWLSAQFQVFSPPASA